MSEQRGRVGVKISTALPNRLANGAITLAMRLMLSNEMFKFPRRDRIHDTKNGSVTGMPLFSLRSLIAPKRCEIKANTTPNRPQYTRQSPTDVHCSPLSVYLKKKKVIGCAP